MKPEELNNMLAEFENSGYKIDINGLVIGKRGHPMKAFVNTVGYYSIVAKVNKKAKNFPIHRLLAIKFIPNPNVLPQVNHKDGNKLNNNIDNLEWVSRSENIRHAINMGLIPIHMKGKTGINNHKSKAVYQIKDGLIIGEYVSMTEAERETGTRRTNILHVINKKRKTAGGYVWKFK